MDDEKNEQQDIWPRKAGIRDLNKAPITTAGHELGKIVPIWFDRRAKLARTEQLDIFNQRLAREWAIETGVIEDVFHIDRGVTLTLIEQGLHAAYLEHGTVDKPVDYVMDILKDHMESLDWLMEEFVHEKAELTPHRIRQLHQLMTRHQGYVDAFDSQRQPVRVPLISGDYKRLPNNVERDGITYLYCPPEKVAEEIEKMCRLHAQHERNGLSPEVQAAWLHHSFTQIHPFQDGNGRVARALATLVFLRAGLFPLVITRDLRREYIETLERADEGELAPLVDIFARTQLDRFDRALNIADELVRPAPSVQLAVQALKAKLERRAEEVAEQQNRVFDVAHVLERVGLARLEEVARLLDFLQTSVTRSNEKSAANYMRQIVRTAKRLHYFADLKTYRSWLRLTLHGEPVGQLIFAFHGRGSEFSGVMVCTASAELISKGGEEADSMDRTPLDVGDAPFEFYYTDDIDDVTRRFIPWVDEMVTLALAQLQRSI